MKTGPARAPLISFVGLSGCGKTSLMAQVIESLSLRGLKIGALKHASHGFAMDRPGKDTFRFRHAGAHAIGIASDKECAVIRTTTEPASLAQLVALLPVGLDLLLCEGFAAHEADKIGVHRDTAPLPAGIPGVIAVVGDSSNYSEVPRFNADDLEAICAFVLARCGLLPAE